MKFGKRHYRPQVDQMDCGVASLAMVFGYYGSYYSLAHLRELDDYGWDNCFGACKGSRGDWF